VRAAGIDQVALKAAGLVFAVRRVEADYISPARYDDMLDVRSTLTALKGASLEMTQEVWRGDALLFRAGVTLVMLTEQGRPARFPADIRARLAPHMAELGS
jgi:acyl-CoA thioester hydrolase